jgi:branched-chain amino acid transport system permease protein
LVPSFVLRILILTLFFLVLTEGLDLVTGYAGLISLGQVVFLGLGGYTSVILFADWGVSPLIGLVVGMLFSALVAVGFGLVAAKLRGIYFAMGTVGMAQLANIIAVNWSLTGGSIGMGWVVSDKPFDLEFTSVVPYYYIFLGMAVGTVLLIYFLLPTAWGYKLRALGSNETAAKAVGINTTRIKIEAFVISAVLTSAVGTFYSFYLAFVNPLTFFTIDTTIELFVIQIIGGAATLFGPVLGAFILVPLSQATITFLGPVAGSLDVAVYSAFLVVFILFRPDGIMSIVSPKGGRRRRLLSTERLSGILGRPKQKQEVAMT